MTEKWGMVSDVGWQFLLCKMTPCFSNYRFQLSLSWLTGGRFVSARRMSRQIFIGFHLPCLMMQAGADEQLKWMSLFSAIDDYKRIEIHTGGQGHEFPHYCVVYSLLAKAPRVGSVAPFQ